MSDCRATVFSRKAAFGPSLEQALRKHAKQRHISMRLEQSFQGTLMGTGLFAPDCELPAPSIIAADQHCDCDCDAGVDRLSRRRVGFASGPLAISFDCRPAPEPDCDCPDQVSQNGR